MSAFEVFDHPGPTDTRTETEDIQPPIAPHLPDLSAIAGNDLRKVPEITAVTLESDGNLYAPIFRQLQIRAEKYYEVHNGVIRVIRNKHAREISRGSDASIRAATGYLLRAFGHIIWKAGSTWLIEAKDLDEGEARLAFQKGRTQDADARYGNVPLHWALQRALLHQMLSMLQILHHPLDLVAPNAQRYIRE